MNKDYVLSTAFCNYYAAKSPELTKVSLGNPKSSLEKDVEGVEVHEDFNSMLHQSDLSVVKLAESVESDMEIRPICLPSNSLEVGSLARMVGFNSDDESKLEQVYIVIEILK